MTDETLKMRLHQAAEKPDEFVHQSYELVSELEVPPSLGHVKTIIRFMEQNPDVDFGAPGPLTNYIERLDIGVYSRLLIESVKTRPTMHTVGMLNSCINTLKDGNRREALKVLKDIVNDPDVGDRAFDLLEYQQKKQPEPEYFAMRVRHERDSRILFSFSGFEGFLSEFSFESERSFWLSPGVPEYPSWNMIRKGDSVYLHFFPSERHAGFHLRSRSHDVITFHADGFDLEIQKGSLTSPATALSILRHYFQHQKLLPDMDWEEL